jgi:hypothetical protein
MERTILFLVRVNIGEQVGYNAFGSETSIFMGEFIGMCILLVTDEICFSPLDYASSGRSTDSR